jgi:hypothetical protein
MSLINEALKKAQRQRAVEASAPAAAKAGGRVARRAAPLSARSIVLIAGGIAVGLMGAVTITIFLVYRDPPPAPPTARPVPAAPVAKAPAAPKPVPVEAPPAPKIEEPAVVTPAPLPPVEKLPPEPNPKVYAFLETLRVAGIRASATDPKVLMNDRVYKLNDWVDRPLGLRLTGVTSSSLTFTDEAGISYEKTF